MPSAAPSVHLDDAYKFGCTPARKSLDSDAAFPDAAVAMETEGDADVLEPVSLADATSQRFRASAASLSPGNNNPNALHDVLVRTRQFSVRLFQPEREHEVNGEPFSAFSSSGDSGSGAAASLPEFPGAFVTFAGNCKESGHLYQPVPCMTPAYPVQRPPSAAAKSLSSNDSASEASAAFEFENRRHPRDDVAFGVAGSSG